MSVTSLTTIVRLVQPSENAVSVQRLRSVRMQFSYRSRDIDKSVLDVMTEAILLR